jgi:hypothetical protein
LEAAALVIRSPPLAPTVSLNDSRKLFLEAASPAVLLAFGVAQHAKQAGSQVGIPDFSGSLVGVDLADDLVDGGGPKSRQRKDRQS